ncbi:MAG: BREX-4 system phosphatase PglZ [Planctomycetaceae bacterium]|nr:BREX-4 system phosphatase PglZ [Planctomycetaceae bacterium]
MAERQAVIEIISTTTNASLRDILSKVYPLLAAYLHRTQIFKHPEITEYFQEYKEQKLFNEIRREFIDKVISNAETRPYNSFPTRNGLVKDIKVGKILLYFVDALGVEFIGLIQEHCKQHGLAANIEFGRADLPTITTVNKKFYEEWNGDKKYSRELDDIKHGKSHTKYALYLAEEIDVVVKILNEIESDLRTKKYEHVVIAADHGASRLVVLNGQEPLHNTTGKSEHYGRCVKVSDCIGNIPSATEENGYWILADYTRFQGSRTAALEVHGGATIEEVLVPVITISLAVNEPVKITLIDDNIIYRPKQPVIITLRFNSPFESVSLNINGQIFSGEKLEDRKHRVVLPGIKAGKYAAEVLENNNSIGNIAFTVQSPAAVENDLGL